MKMGIRKIIIFVILIALTATAIDSLTNGVRAEETKRYSIPELELSIAVPPYMSVYTRDVCENMSLLERKGYTYKELVSRFKTQQIYFDAIDEAKNREIVVTMTKVSSEDFNLLSDANLNVLAIELGKLFEYTNGMFFKHDLYVHSQAKFLRISFYNKTDGAYGLQYYTIYRGNAINITLRSYSGPIDETQEALIKTVVDNVKFEKESLRKDIKITPKIAYVEAKTGMSFTVPQNWTQKELSQPREIIKAKFSTNSNEEIPTGPFPVKDKRCANYLCQRIGRWVLEFKRSAIEFCFGKTLDPSIC